MALSPKRPVKRGLWTWHSPPQMIFFSSIVLWSWSTIHPQSVYSLGADIYVSHPQSPPSHLQDYSTCNSARWLNLFPWFDPNEWCMKNGLLSGGLNPGPRSHESSALPLDHGYSPVAIYIYIFQNDIMQSHCQQGCNHFQIKVI
jgi:hypothetical protein